MKKIFIAAMLLAGTGMLSAQNIYNTSSNLTSNRLVGLYGKYLYFKPTSGSFFINGTTGNVGINTTGPTETLHVNGNIKGNTGIFQGNFSNPSLSTSFSSSAERFLKSRVITGGASLDASYDARVFAFYDMPLSNLGPAQSLLSVQDRSHTSRFLFSAENGSGGYMKLYDKGQQVNFGITDDGSSNITVLMPKVNTYMCIGTTSYTDGTDYYSLSVNGNVRANRVKVYTTWADYVFEDDYELPTLEEVEKHIVEKGHLKDIPSAAEVEENGIELGEMNKLLLQKIEELTLYTIELNKQVQELKAERNKQ